MKVKPTEDFVNAYYKSREVTGHDRKKSNEQMAKKVRNDNRSFVDRIFTETFMEGVTLKTLYTL